MFRYPTPTLAAEAGYAIAGDRFAILLGSGVAEGVIARLWNAAAADTAVLEDVLSVLVAGGIHDLPDFAVAEFPDDGADVVRVAVRGAAIVETSDRTRVSGADARTWIETPVAGTQLQVWRSLINGDFGPTTSVPNTPCTIPGCSVAYSRYYFTGYIDYALDCATNQWQVAFGLTHECDGIHHTPASVRPASAPDRPVRWRARSSTRSSPR